MFFMAHASLVLILVMLIVIIRYNNKASMSMHFMVYLVGLFIWTLSVIAEEYSAKAGYANLVIIFENLTYLGIAFIAITFVMIGMAFNGDTKRPRINPLYLYIIPTVTQFVIWTNPLHHAFYISYDLHSGIVVGWYFFVHTAYSYACLMTGLYLIIKFAFNSRGDSHWQAILTSVATAIPLIVNICYTLGLRGFTIFSTPIAFTFTVIIHFIGVYRFNLFAVAPIALRSVIDRISDLYIVVDEHMRILDYNEPFMRVFGPHLKIKKNLDMRAAMLDNRVGVEAEDIYRVVCECRDTGVPVKREFMLPADDGNRYYTTEFTPLILENAYCGCILLLHDVTQAKNDMEEIRRNQTMLIERERLASLGQLIGGIAHNLKTPLMAISGRVESLHVLINEYRDSLDDENVTKEDHAEISREMQSEVGKIKSHISYISDIISTVKDQTARLNTGTRDFFTVMELLKRVEILMQHELMRNGCEMTVESLLKEDLRLDGDINSLVQILDNIIINAIQAYKSIGVNGLISLKIWQSPTELFISVTDNAGGIKMEVQKKLFRQMTTTKGTEGTGLGLYISYSTIIGMFGGKMSFSSTEGQGTEFMIALPLEPVGAR